MSVVWVTAHFEGGDLGVSISDYSFKFFDFLLVSMERNAGESRGLRIN